MTGRRSFFYVLTSGGIALLLLATILLLNILVDPLWFFGGDKLLPRNFAFDERTARAARFASSPRNYNCYIFGASRVSLINENRFAGYTCFMFAFAAATPRELVAFAEYAKKFQKAEPRLIVVGIDDFDFIEPADSFTVPSFVRDGQLPKFWNYYLSMRVATWSIETLFDRSPLERYYGADLTGQVRPDARTFQTKRLTLPPGQHWDFSDENAGTYAAFRRIFPHAHLVGYVTPIAADRVLEYDRSGVLHDYLHALIEAVKSFDEAYDFSIPSPVTLDPAMTYDGSHFYPIVGDRIINAILSHNSDFGVRLDGLSAVQLQNLYAERIKSLLGPKPTATDHTRGHALHVQR